MAKSRSKAVPAKSAPAGGDGKAMLENAVGQIEKMFGQGSIMKLNSPADAGGIPGIATGALSLDIALGGRG
ncbi:MAG: DNA recombination/repair protein RecA, partial [Fuerstiella sp.]|nr:DNA recombination/repair protein RecA [Fuerstiella sp.]